MSRTAAIPDPYDLFFHFISAASSRVLALDYDGTIAPFTANRHRALPYPKIPRLLQRIMNSCSTRLIIVSGRSAHEVPSLLGLCPPPEIWGTHGIERRSPQGHYDETHVSEEALHTLTEAEIQLDCEGLAERVEVKLAGVAVHWRGLPELQVLDVRTKAYHVLEPLTAQTDLVLAEFEGGVELRLRSANKGEAMRALIAETDPNTPIAYLGDDATDEDAFRVLNGRGLSILVGPKQHFTAAHLWLKPPQQLIGFLTDWIRACGGMYEC